MSKHQPPAAHPNRTPKSQAFWAELLDFPREIWISAGPIADALDIKRNNIQLVLDRWTERRWLEVEPGTSRVRLTAYGRVKTREWLDSEAARAGGAR